MATSKLTAHVSAQANAKMDMAAERVAQQGIESAAPSASGARAGATPAVPGPVASPAAPAASQKGMMGRYRNKKKLMQEVEARKAKARPVVVGPDGKVIVARPKTDSGGRRQDSGDIWC